MDIQAKAAPLLKKEGKHLNKFQRTSIITLLGIGMSVKAVQKTIGCDRRTIRRWINAFFDQGNTECKNEKGQGRLELLNEEEKTLIVARAAEDPFVTPGMIKAELNLDCSSRTIDRVLIQAGLYGRVAMRSYPYTETQKQIRLSYSNFILSKSDDFYKRILITDESSIQLGLHGNRVYVRRPKGDQMKWADEYVWKDESKRKSGTIKFFASFCWEGVGDLYFYEKMNGKKMTEIIDNNILPMARRFFPRGEWFVLHDNDKKWRNYEVEAHKHCKGVTQLFEGIWPSYSPDLNPIENLFGDLSSRVFDRNPCGVDELKEFILEEWKNTEKQMIQKLVLSFRNRCQAVVDSQGCKTKY